MNKLLSVLLIAVFALGPSVLIVLAQDKPQVAARPEDIDEKTEKAIDKGLAYLARAQNRDGSFNLGDGRGAVGITGLAGIAFLAGGHTPGRGQYGSNVQRCVDFVIKNTNMTTGYINSGNSRMYQHGFAMLFLAEVIGMTPDEDVRKGLIQAVRLLKAAQNPQGGWRYSPTPTDADLSVTVCQIMALRAARNAGIHVQPAIINNGIKYVSLCYSKSNHTFGYMPGSGGRFATTAAGVCTLFYAGQYEDKKAKSALDYLLKQHKSQGFQSYPMYGNYYAVQAMHLARERETYWSVYFPFVRDRLVSSQKSDGSWNMSHGPHYSTAMACIILQVPNEYLPILQH